MYDMQVSNELMQGLNDLLARSRDAQKGYIEASNHINTPQVRKWLLEYSDQRLKFSVELENEIRRLGGEPDDSTSVLGDLHRVWIDLKGMASDDEPMAMLEECQRGEQKALEDYTELLNQHQRMSPATFHLLKQHKTKIEAALALIHSLKEIFEPADS